MIKQDVAIPIYLLSIAPPKIVRFESRQSFHWCLYYEIKGYPIPERTWLFKQELLLHSDDIVDIFENPLQGILPRHLIYQKQFKLFLYQCNRMFDD